MRPAEMVEEPEAEPQVHEPAAVPRWNLARRIAFRFLFSYFLLYFLTGQEIKYIPLIFPLVNKYTEIWYAIAVWVGKHLFRISYDFPMLGDGSGDTTFRWILLTCYGMLAAVATVLWSVLDRKRIDYERLHQWFRLLLRFSLAGALIVYGIAKAIPNQMSAPSPFRLLTRVADLPPMAMLWTFMGSSPAYQSITGVAELLAGLLLLVPRMTLLGAVIAIADMTMVVTLNLCYDVPVKITSFHYLMMAIILAAPDLSRLADLFLFNRTVRPAARPPALFARKWLDRAPHALLFAFGLYLIGTGIASGIEVYRERHPPRPPLYGAWSTEAAANGEAEPGPAGAERWRWVVFQNAGFLGVELPSGELKGYALDHDTAQQRMTVWDIQVNSEGKAVRDAAGKPLRLPSPKAKLAYKQPDAGTLVLEGVLDGQPIRIELYKAAFLSQRFHWIAEQPFN